MRFEAVLNEAISMLQRLERVSYRSLKRQFDLDDSYLEDLKEALLYTHSERVNDDGQGFIWKATPPAPISTLPGGTELANRFHAVLPLIMGLLQRERRVPYHTLKYAFGLDEALLAAVCSDLSFRQLAQDANSQGLVWTGEGEATRVPSAAIPTPPPLLTPSVMPTNGPTAPSEDAATDGPPNEPIAVPNPTHNAPEAERRQLTVMFCDLAGSTQLSGQLDPEDLREVVRAYQETAAEVIERFEGHIAQYLGDGLLVYFGYPRAHEDDAQRAVHAGLGIIEAMVALNTRLEVSYNVQLAVRLGIHTGPAVVGEMGGGDRHELLALGETPNIASRLEGLAVPNTIVMSAITASLVRHAFVLEELGLQDLRGVSTPMAAARVIGPRDAHDNLADTEPGKSVLLVGRDEEVGLLRRRWSQSNEGIGQVVLISGEAGIGKSSLVQTVGHQVTQERATRITVRCSPYYSNSALYPVITHLQRVLRWNNSMPAEVKVDILEQFLHGLALPTNDMVPLLAALLAVPVPEGQYPPLALSPQQQRQQTHDALVACLMAETERKPVLVVWEDLHWADPSTLEMLGVLIDQTPTVPMLHVLTFRPEFMPAWPMRSHMTPITLNRLERPQVEAIIAHQVNGKSLPTEVVEHIVTKTDGVPLFVEELTKMLLESPLLSDAGDQYALTGPLSEAAIPATLHDSLMARLDRLPTVRVVAQLGAVLGREFDYEMLQALAGVEESTLQDGLAQLVEAELLYQRGRPPRAHYIFKHALVQDAAYASLLRSTRQQYHQRMAQVLVEQFPETAEMQPELVAYHYTEAGLSEHAIGYWQSAGQSAIARSAHAEAIAHLSKALVVLKTLSDPSEQTQYELDIQLVLGQALTFIKGQAAPEVGQAYNRARELCLQMGDEQKLFRILYGLWHFHVVRAELQTVRELSEELLRLAQYIDNPMYLHGAHFVMGGIKLFLGEFTLAREHLEKSFALYDPHQHRDNVFLFGFDLGVFSLCCLPHALWHLGYAEQALSVGQQALDLAQELSHPFSLAVALDYVAMLHQFCCDKHTAQEQTTSAIALCSTQGFAYYLAWARLMQGWSLTMPGKGEEGITQMRDGLESLRATGGQLRLPYYLSLMAESYGQAGQVEAGLSLLNEALTLTEKTEERWRVAELYRLKGDLLLQQAVPDESQAERYFHKALHMACHQHTKALELRTVISLGHLKQRQGKDDEAWHLLSEVYNWFTEGFDTADLQDAKALLQELA